MEEKAIENKRIQTEQVSLKEVVLKLREYYGYLLSKWLIIVLLGLLGGVLGIAYAWFKKPIYVAATTFVLEEGEKGGGLGQYAGLASMVGIDLGGGGGGIFQGDNILALYKSRSMIQRTLLTEVEYDNKKQLLIDRYIDFNKLRESWKSKPNLKNIQFTSSNVTRVQDSILGSIVKDIDKGILDVAKPDKKLNIIKVEVQSGDEFFAKNFNEQIVKNVNDFYVRTKTKKSIDNVAILQQKTDSVRAVMNGAIYTGAVTADATPNLNPARQAQRVVPMQRSQFNAETNKEILGELVKNLELSKISLRKETPLIQVIDQPIYPLEVSKAGKSKSAIVGGLLFGFLTVIILLINKILKDLMA